jgi:integrase
MQTTKINTQELLGRYIDYLAVRELAESTIKEYVIYFRIFPHDNISQDTVNEFVIHHKGSIAKAFVTSYLKFMKIKDIEVPETTGRKRKRYTKINTREEMETLREALYLLQERYGIMYDVTLEGLLRRNETISVKPQDFEWNSWGQDKSKPIRLRVIGKGNKERIVVISSQTAERVRNYISPLLKDGSILMNQPMFKISKHEWWRVIRDVSIAVLGKRIKPHSIRHYRSSELLETNAFSLPDLQRILGHSSIATTQIYLHPDEEVSIKKFEEFMK